MYLFLALAINLSDEELRYFLTQGFFGAVPLCKSVCFYNLCIRLGHWISLSLLIANLKKCWTVGANECKIWSVRLQNFC